MKRSNLLRAAGLTEDLDARKMEAFKLHTENSKQLDCKTVGFFLRISKESVKRGVRVLRAKRASLTRP